MVGLVPMAHSPPTTVASISPKINTGAAGRLQPRKSLLRRGTIRKLSDTDLELALDTPTLPLPPHRSSSSTPSSSSSSPRKRPRVVTFNPHVEEKVMEVYSGGRCRRETRTLETVRAEVISALEGKRRGECEAYDDLVEVFAPRKRPGRSADDAGEDAEERREEGEDTAVDDGDDDESGDAPDVKLYLLALTSLAAMLNKDCSGLVKAVLAMEWMGRDESFVKVYMQFLGSLVSAHGVYVKAILEKLIEHFAGVRFSSGRLPGYPDVPRNQLIGRVHAALKYLLRVIPSASSLLAPEIERRFPDAEDTKKEHVIYLENLIRLTDYAPELKAYVFSLITEKLVKIDVQMQVDLDDLDDEVAAAIVQAISLGARQQNEDEDEDSNSDVDSVTSDDDLNINSRRVKEVQANVEKMDAILDFLFTIYDPYFSDPHSQEAAAMFDTLLQHFSNIILPTYRSRHTQFLLFHFAQTAEHLVDQFAGTCVQLAFQPGRPAVLKQSSAAYLASFVARGAHVPSHIVRTVFELIGSHLDLIRTDNELTCRGPDLQRYSTFYAMSQALLYIFCFRWRDLITSTDILEEDDPSAFITQDLTFIPGIKETLSRTIYSKLNPLKICSPPIVAEFAKIATHLRFMYVYPLLETNKRIRLSQFSSSRANGALRDPGHAGTSESWHQLDAYFPFDPYQLPISKRWIEGDYVQWVGIPGLNQDEDSESEDDEDDDEDDVAEDDSATDEDDE